MSRYRHVLFLMALAAAGASFFLKGSAPDALFPAPFPIVTYHRISNEYPANDGGRTLPVYRFREHLEYLSMEGFTPIHFKDYLAIRAGRMPCPDKPVILTFDDGYADNFYEAYPLIRKYGFKATFFPIVGHMGHSGHMTWKKLRRLDPKVIEIGSHTMTHRALAGCSAKTLAYELVESKLTLEQYLLEPIIAFAFPYGSFDDRSVRATGLAEYRVACTTVPGLNRWDGDPMRLKRFTVGRHHSLEYFIRMVEGRTRHDRLPPVTASTPAMAETTPAE